MTNINLYQNQQKKQSIFYAIVNNGLFFSISILVFVILVLVGLKSTVYFFNKQNSDLINVINEEKSNIIGLSNLDQVVDMQTRLKEIKNNLQIKNNQVSRAQMTQVIDHMAAEINERIVVSTYRYENEKNKVILTFNANNFNEAAQQILGFKDSDYFSNVNLVKISRGEKAIVCDIEMNVKL